ncbi:MAG: hypothetical protein IJ702_04960 [Fretibacterium sp.]|nr:hypothetical protein [Fretibacterium sp.]
MIKLNVTGKTDPLPLVSAALAKGAEEIQVTAGDTAPALKVKQFLERKGFGVRIQDDNGQLTLTGSRGELSAVAGTGTPRLLAVPLVTEATNHAGTEALPHAGKEAPPLAGKEVPPHAGQKAEPHSKKEGTSPVYLIMRRTLGQGDPEFGEVLIRSFLRTLAGRRATPPAAAVILMNEGVQLARFDTSACDHLKVLEARGVRVLVSGTCAAHFSITESIGVGTLANMYEIVETLSAAERTVTL